MYSAELTRDRVEGCSSESPEASLGSTTNPLPDLLGGPRS